MPGLPPTVSWASKQTGSQPATPVLANAPLPSHAATNKLLGMRPKGQQVHPLPPRPPSRARQESSSAAARPSSPAARPTPAPSAIPPSAPARSSTPTTSTPDRSPPRVPKPSTSSTQAPSETAAEAPLPEALPDASHLESVENPPESSLGSDTTRAVPEAPEELRTEESADAEPALPPGLADVNLVATVEQRQEFDPILETLGAGSFSFSLDLDPKGKAKLDSPMDVFGISAPGLARIADGSAEGSPASSFRSLPDGPPNGLVANGMTANASYSGSFNPFSDSAEGNEDGAGTANGANGVSSQSSSPSSIDPFSRRSSRFGFARRGSSNLTRSEAGLSISRLSSFDDSSPLPGFGPPGVPLPLSGHGRPPSRGFTSPLSPFTDIHDSQHTVSSAIAIGTPTGGGNSSTSAIADPSDLFEGVNLAASYSTEPPPPRSHGASQQTESSTSRAPAPDQYSFPGASNYSNVQNGRPQMNSDAARFYPSATSNDTAGPFPPGFNFGARGSMPSPVYQHPSSRSHPTGPGGNGSDELFSHISGMASSAGTSPSVYSTGQDPGFQDPAILNARLAGAGYGPSNTLPPSYHQHQLNGHAAGGQSHGNLEGWGYGPRGPFGAAPSGAGTSGDPNSFALYGRGQAHQPLPQSMVRSADPFASLQPGRFR